MNKLKFQIVGDYLWKIEEIDGNKFWTAKNFNNPNGIQLTAQQIIQQVEEENATEAK